MLPKSHAVALLAVTSFVMTIFAITFGSLYVLEKNKNSASANGNTISTESEVNTLSPTTPGPVSSLPSGNPSKQPTGLQTGAPTFLPTAPPTDLGSSNPSAIASPLPSEKPSLSPSATESATTLSPSSSIPSSTPSSTPSMQPTLRPTAYSTTSFPSSSLTSSPGGTTSPSMQPTIRQFDENTTTIFYAIADVPYSPREAAELADQVRALPDDAEFLIHLGDIRSAADTEQRCLVRDYIEFRDIVSLCPVPVFLVIGDNEWNDCLVNINGAWNRWMLFLQGMETRFWPPRFDISRLGDRDETFTFLHKHTLFIGLNLVGGFVHNRTEWDERHAAQLAWVKELIVSNTQQGNESAARSVVLFAHALPSRSQEDFFNGLQTFLASDLAYRVPILYLHGDGHAWLYETNFLGQPNALQIQLKGGTSELPLKITVSPPTDREASTSNTFFYDRRLDPDQQPTEAAVTPTPTFFPTSI